MASDNFRAAAARHEGAPRISGGGHAISITANIDGAAELAPANEEVARLREEVAILRQELSVAIETLQIMQEELQAAHDALSHRAANEAR